MLLCCCCSPVKKSAIDNSQQVDELTSKLIDDTTFDCGSQYYKVPIHVLIVLLDSQLGMVCSRMRVFSSHLHTVKIGSTEVSVDDNWMAELLYQ